MQWISRLICALTWLATTGCNHLFYHPDQIVYVTPKKLGLAHTEMSIPTADGEHLSAWLIAGEKPKIGTVLHFHGNAQNMTAHLPYVAWLAQYGFDIITFDYRGFGRSTGHPDRQGLVIDGAAALRLLGSFPEPRYVIAQSLGGAVLIPSLARAKETTIAGVLLDSTFSSYRSIAQDKLSSTWLTWPLQWPLSFLVSDELSPKQFASQVIPPVAVMHGDQDNIVPINEGITLFQHLPDNQKQFWMVDGGHHLSGFVSPNSPFRMRLLEFLCKHHPTPERCQTLLTSHLNSLKK